MAGVVRLWGTPATTPRGVSIPLQRVTSAEFGAVGSLQLRCGVAALRKSGGMAPPTGEGGRASILLLPTRMRLRNLGDAFLGEGRNRSDLSM
jgi:hypothetical protein